MLITNVQKGSYHDSVVLMLLTNELSGLEGVRKASVMMATPANKEIFKRAGLDTAELAQASANDMVIVADVDDAAVSERIEEQVSRFFAEQAASGKTAGTTRVKSWSAARKALPQANLAVISIPGAYAALEAEHALREGMSVFMFSDNVTIEDERRLKEMAHEKGLCLMGPDCGTGIIQGVPIAFTNHVRKGAIGIIGASGTGIQELTCIIDRLGEGVNNAIGTGGRDLSEEIGGVTMLDMIDAMEQDREIQVILILSKPPAPAVRERVLARLRSCRKPVVTLFLGEKPAYHEENLYHCYTCDEAARTAVRLVRGERPRRETESLPELPDAFSAKEGKSIKAYYSGGTLANEAAMLIKDALQVQTPPEKEEGCMLNLRGNVVVDLGDDVYTVGHPHPMIDPAKRIECMERCLEDESTGVILFDVMLGYGSHEDMAGALLPTISALRERAAAAGRKLFFAASVCGTRQDPQGYDKASEQLRRAGVIVCESNKAACHAAIRLAGLDFAEPEKEIRPRAAAGAPSTEPSRQLLELLADKPRVINIGLPGFAEVCESFGCQVVQFDWTPPAGGDFEMIRTLEFLNRRGDIDAANQRVIAGIVAAQPVLRDNIPARDVIPELSGEVKTILHAGPPIAYRDMPETVQGSCVGAVLFEGWAETEAEARALLASGEVRFLPCHHVNAVGPMGGITTAHMPVWVVENVTEGNRAYCTMNEGIGKVLRFGAYSREVIERLCWMRDVLGPTLGRALRALDGGLPLNPLIAKAIAMGDEFHQRNIAASLVLLKELVPTITRLDMDEAERTAVVRFLAETDQFFLNVMMAAGKAIMDGARKVREGTVVTAMCRNGVEFGIRIAGMGDEWFTGPVNIPQGLYFTGYDGGDACPDIGDSAITETVGVGGMAMIAAPAVTRFVGAGGTEDARRTSNEMTEITISRNPNYIIPNWDFQGTCLGIDARLVVEKGITPVINTGIAHRQAGFGQIGAGTVRPPLACFEKAVAAYARKLGYGGSEK